MRNLFKAIITHAEKIILIMAAVQQENSRNVPSLLKNEYERDEFLLVGLCQFSYGEREDKLDKSHFQIT